MQKQHHQCQHVNGRRGRRLLQSNGPNLLHALENGVPAAMMRHGQRQENRAAGNHNGELHHVGIHHAQQTAKHRIDHRDAAKDQQHLGGRQRAQRRNRLGEKARDIGDDQDGETKAADKRIDFSRHQRRSAPVTQGD